MIKAKLIFNPTSSNLAVKEIKRELELSSHEIELIALALKHQKIFLDRRELHDGIDCFTEHDKFLLKMNGILQQKLNNVLGIAQ